MTEQIARFPYQDDTLAVEQRIDDLVSRMEIEDKAGLLFQPMAALGDFDTPGMFGTPPTRTLFDRRINHFNILMAPTAREIANWNNAIQAEARQQALGIPVTISSDPRHSFADNPGASIMAGPFSQWPEPLGFAAIGDVDLVARWAHVVRQEYVAVGIRTALHPQIDLASDPRWARASTTFGSDAELTARLGETYIKGLQGNTVGSTSVSAMAKHFPGGGPQKDGEDPHFAYGREQVYPGGNFDLHLEPFKAAIAAGVSQIMPYYGMPVGTAYEEVGFGFNKGVITGILRDQLGFDGIVCTDWGILTNMCWGVEDLSVSERMVKAFDAGVDQFGGESDTDTFIGLARTGTISMTRINASVRRVLREKFRLGLFDDPFVDADTAERIVGTAAAREEGIVAQAAAQTLLENAVDGPARLPLGTALKVYVEGMAPEAFDGRATVVATSEEADVAVVRLTAPWEERGKPGEFENFFHAGSLAFSPDQIAHLRDIHAKVPTVVDVYLDRPALLGQISDTATTLMANFGSSEDAFIRVLFGDVAPRGRLPFEIPSSMATVRASSPDVPNDTVNPSYPARAGLDY